MHVLGAIDPSFVTIIVAVLTGIFGAGFGALFSIRANNRLTNSASDKNLTERANTSVTAALAANDQTLDQMAVVHAAEKQFLEQQRDEARAERDAARAKLIANGITP